MSEASFTFNAEKKLPRLTIQPQSNSGYYNDWNEQGDKKSIELGKGEVNGLKWKWICNNDTSSMTTTSEKVLSSYIQFIWNHKAMKGAEGFKGTATFFLSGPNINAQKKVVEFCVNYSGGWTGERCLHIVKEEDRNSQQNGYYHQNDNYTIKIQVTCTPFYAACKLKNTEILARFSKTEATDATLSIEGTAIHVNKSFLSFHSKYFEKLFSNQYKEHKSVLVELKGVSLDDFSKFLSLIYPDAIEPTVEKIERYLQLADMYLMPAATRQCEKFLLNSPRVKDIQKIVLADKYGLDKLLKSTLLSIDNQEDLKALTRLPEFATLGNDTTAAFMERFMHFL